MSDEYQVPTIEDYLAKTGLKAEDILSKEEANRIVNEHVIECYRGRVTLREEKIFNGYEIAEKLHIIVSTFYESVKKACGEDDEDE